MFEWECVCLLHCALGLVVVWRMNASAHVEVIFHSHTLLLPTLGGSVKVVLFTSAINRMIDFSRQSKSTLVFPYLEDHLDHSLTEKPPFWTKGCFYVGIDQQRYLLLISLLHYYVWWIDWQFVARDQFVKKHWTLSENSTIMSQSWMASNPRGMWGQRMCVYVCG